MHATCTTDVFTHFPQLATDPDRFLDALRSFLNTDEAKQRGLLSLLFRITESGSPELEFTIAIPDPTGEVTEIAVFFPSDALVLHIGRCVLDESLFQALENVIIAGRTRTGPDVFQRYVYRLPGVGWKPVRTSRAGIFFGRRGVDLPTPFDLFIREESGRITIQTPFQAGMAKSSGIDLNIRPIIVNALLAQGMGTAVYVLDALDEADMNKARFSGRADERYDRYSCQDVRLLVDASERGLAITARDTVVCMRPDRMYFSMSQLIVDPRLTVGAICQWKIPGPDGCSGQGIISEKTHSFRDNSTSFHVDLPKGS